MKHIYLVVVYRAKQYIGFRRNALGNLEVYARRFSTTFGSHGEIYFGQKKSGSNKFSRPR